MTDSVMFNQVGKFICTFLDSGRKAQCPPDPDYPDGMVIDQEGVEKTCKVEVPYPSPGCGVLIVRCIECGLKVAVTVAGRPDDVRLIVMPCKVGNSG